MSELKYGRYLHHYETDSDGVCHFSNYFRIFEEAFASALREIVIAPAGLDHSFAVTEAHSVYQRPIKYGDFFDVKFSFTTVRRSFFVASGTISVNHVVCAEVSGKFAAVGKDDNKSTPLDLNLRNALNKLHER